MTNKTYPIVVVSWTESERGWGKKPDGFSIHLSNEDAKKYIEEFDKAEQKINKGKGVPGCYSYNETSFIVTDVEYKIWKKLKYIKNNKGYGYKIYSLQEIETENKKMKREALEEKQKTQEKLEKDRIKKLKMDALAKLSDEEKEVLGLNKETKTSLYHETYNRGWY